MCSAQGTISPSSDWIVGFDIGTRSMLNTISFEGSMYRDPEDQRLDEWWVDPSSLLQTECSPSLSLGAHIRRIVWNSVDDVSLSLGFSIGYYSTTYSYRNMSFNYEDFYRKYDDFVITSINLLPSIRADAQLSSRIRFFIGVGFGMALLNMMEEHKSDCYDIDNDYPWGNLKYSASAHTTNLLFNPSVGLNILMSSTFSLYAMYDIQYLSSSIFFFDKIERKGTTPIGTWSFVRYDRDRYFRLSNSAFRAGIEIGL